MEKITVLARINFTIKFSDELLAWLSNFQDSWFAKEEGNAFLSEYGGKWKETFKKITDEEVRKYFSDLGLQDEYLPFVQLGETYRGSWVLEAAIVISGTIGFAFAVLKGVSEIPKIAEGFSDLKERIADRLKPEIAEDVTESLSGIAENSVSNQSNVIQPAKLLPPPQNSVVLNLTIDARPLTSLTPAILKSHSIHLSIAVSRDSFTLENLGDTPLHDVNIGLFRTETQRQQWSYQDSHMGNFPLVSGHQTIAKSLGEFRDDVGNRFDLSDGQEVYIDCWVSDSHGIYLFHFFLEAE